MKMAKQKDALGQVAEQFDKSCATQDILIALGCRADGLPRRRTLRVPGDTGAA